MLAVMRLLLIGNYPLDRAGSMDRYAEMLRRELSARGHTVQIERPAAWFGRLLTRGTAGKYLGYLDKYLLYPWRLRGLARGWDRVHICDQANAVYLPYLPPGSSITCHDVIAIEAAAGSLPHAEVGRRVSGTGRVQQAWIRKHLVHAQRIVAVSHATAARLRAMGTLGEIHVIHNALHRPFQPASAASVASIRSRADLPENSRYWLHVGGNQWYKNRLGALRIFARLRRRAGFEALQLIMAGAPWTEEMRVFVRQEGIEAVVRPLLDISDDGLEALYTGAEALLFPSLTEGFGWPVIEAQSCGTLVITSDREVLREIAGDGAIFIDPTSPQAAEAVMIAAWESREEVRLRGLNNVHRFAAAPLMQAYEDFFQAAREADK